MLAPTPRTVSACTFNRKVISDLTNIHGLILVWMPSIEIAMAAIKANYQVEKNWMSDPCIPKTLAWNGLICVYATSGRPRIVGL
jgi:hypothetical protein